MKSIRRVLLSTAAIGGLMALTATTNALEPGYGTEPSSSEPVTESRESTGGETGYATGGETGSGCAKKGAAGTGAGGTTDVDTSETNFSGTAGATGPGAAGTERAPGTSLDQYPGR